MQGDRVIWGGIGLACVGVGDGCEREIERFLKQWQMDATDLRRRLLLARHPGSGKGGTSSGSWTRVGLGLDRLGGVRGTGPGPPHHRTMGRGLRKGRTCGLDIRADWGFLPALGEAEAAELRAAVQEPPAIAGIELANWNWKVVRQFVLKRFGINLSRSSCLNYLHHLGFVLNRPKKRLVKADPEKREAFVPEYAALTERAGRCGARIFFADETHYRSDAELPGKWVLKGEPALVDSTSPRRGEKASYYSSVCLETGEVEWMELEGNSNGVTSASFLKQLWESYPGPLTVIWDNAPAHRGPAMRSYLEPPVWTCGW